MQTEKEESGSMSENRHDKWAPENWIKTWNSIEEIRSQYEAPVDEMGTYKPVKSNQHKFTENDVIFHHLVGLMLSAQTRDQVTYSVLRDLIDEHRITIEKVSEIDE